MTKIETLMNRVEKAKQRVEKKKATTQKYKKQIEKKRQMLEDKGIDIERLKEFKSNPDGGPSQHYWDISEYEYKVRDAEEAEKKLLDEELTLSNWQEKLKKEEEKERFIYVQAPQVLLDFLQNWKAYAFDWYIKRYSDYQELKMNIKKEVREAKIECIKTTPEYAYYLDDKGSVSEDFVRGFVIKGPMEEYLRERELDSTSIGERKFKFAGAAVLQMDSIRKEEKRLEWLEDTLEKEREVKLFNLISRINKTVGTIIDASHLEVGADGDLNGVITGEKGKVRVQTISAGGFNIQCFHFRTLVHKIKE